MDNDIISIKSGVGYLRGKKYFTCIEDGIHSMDRFKLIITNSFNFLFPKK